MGLNVVGALTHKTVATFTVPQDVYAVCSCLTEPEILQRHLTFLASCVAFLNEIAPHGYRLLAFDLECQGGTIVVLVHLLVTETDHRFIQSEWSPLASPDANEHREESSCP